MQRTPLSAVAILVIGLLAAIFLSVRMTKDKIAVHAIEPPAQAQRVYVPVLGLDKFWADVSWMKTLNQMGAVKSRLTEPMARYFLQQYERITDLDPDFAKVYEVGAPFIAHQLTEEAIDLLDKGQDLAREPDWNRPYMAAHWLVQLKARNAKDEEEKRDYQSRAIAYVREAIETGQQPWYVETMLLRLLSRRDGFQGDPLAELRSWSVYYDERFAEASAGYAGTTSGISAVGTMDETIDSLPGSENLLRIRERILNRCTRLMRESIETGGEKDAAIRDSIRAIYLQMSPTERVSPHSLMPYDPGELFDPLTGQPLVPYGVDLYDLEVHGRVTPIRGPFNTITGHPIAATFDTLREMLKKEDKTLTRLKEHTPEAVGF